MIALCMCTCCRVTSLRVASRHVTSRHIIHSELQVEGESNIDMCFVGSYGKVKVRMSGLIKCVPSVSMIKISYKHRIACIGSKGNKAWAACAYTWGLTASYMCHYDAADLYACHTRDHCTCISLCVRICVAHACEQLTGLAGPRVSVPWWSETLSRLQVERLSDASE